MSTFRLSRKHLRWVVPASILAAASIAAALALGGGAAPSSAAAPNGNSVIVLIGDGMGGAQRTASQLANYGYGQVQPMDALPEGGNLFTHSASPVTDSSASATAMATGVKTHNDYAGVDGKGNDLKTLLEQARDQGKSTGVIDDNDVTNATIAGFAAHTDNRDHKREIAEDMLFETKPDLIFGGGEKIWYPKGDKGKIPDRIPDDKSNNKALVPKAQELGYQYAYDRDTFAELTGPKALALVQQDAYLRGHELRGYRKSKDPHFVPMPELVRKALEILSQNPNGFFLVAEVDEIDDAGHEHDGKTVISLGRMFNDMVTTVTDYQRTDPNALLVVTADHETGGMGIEPKADPSTNSPGDDPVPAYGKPQNLPRKGGKTPIRSGPFKVKGTKDRFKADWTTEEHAGLMVPVTAAGPGATRFSGVHENTWVHTVASDVLNGG